MNAAFFPQALSPPPAAKATLLLAEFCPVKTPGSQNIFDPKLLALRANLITSVLKEIISPPGWIHGGIND